MGQFNKIVLRQGFGKSMTFLQNIIMDNYSISGNQDDDDFSSDLSKIWLNQTQMAYQTM